jgi:class 3 adenylate cyclase
MTEREVRYCTTEDGVRIAYCSAGDGPPLVMTPFFVESFSLHHLAPEIDLFLDRLRAARRVVLYDPRGTGLSQRDAVAGPAEVLNDLEAVVAAAGEGPIGLWANFSYGASAVRLAARSPDSLDRLVLYAAYARRSDAFSDEAMRSFGDLARTNWELAAQTFGDMSARAEDPAGGFRYGQIIRQSITGETMAKVFAIGAANDDDARAELAKIRVPTLVVHRKGDLNVPIALGQQIAAAIPGAVFVPVDGVISAYALGDTEPILRAALPFLSTRAGVTRAESSAAESASVRTVLWTDLVGHTEMMQRLGDERGRAVLREHERITREVLKAHDGHEIKTMGDGFMASFASVTKAVECAIALQRAFAEWNVGAHGHAPLHVRVGLNAGEPIAEKGDLFGAMVILASRIAAQAAAGEILIPEPVRHLLAGKEFAFSDRGEFVPKGFEDAVRLYEVRWRE